MWLGVPLSSQARRRACRQRRLAPLLEALETLCFLRRLSVRTYCLEEGLHAYLKVWSSGSDTWFVVGGWWSFGMESRYSS